MGEPSWRIVWVTDAIPAGGSDQVWLGSIQLPPVATRARHRAATRSGGHGFLALSRGRSDRRPSCRNGASP